MSIANMLSHGLGAYMQTSSALEEREARKTARQREQERHEGWKAENAARMEDRAETKAEKAREKEETDLLFGGIADFVSRSGADQQTGSPVVAEQVTAALPNGGIDQGKGVTTYPAGANPATEQTQVARQPDGRAQIVSPGNGIPVIELGAPVKPVNMDAAFASRGVAQPAQPAAPQGYDFNALQQDKSKLDALRIRAAKANNPNAMAMLNEQSQALLGKWAASYPGDPTAKPWDYAIHVAKGGAAFGKPLTPEAASKIYTEMKAYESEGALKALTFAHRGDTASALAAYNAQGNHKFVDVKLVPAKSSTGLDSFNIVGINPDGSQVNMGNAFDNMTRAASAEQQLKMFIEQQKLKNDTRKTDADVMQSRASANASNASAGAQRANAAQTNFETDYMKKHGIKPGGGGAGGNDKSAELLNKYSGWFKSSLQIGDTMMSSVDPEEANKRQMVYERAMGIAQREIANGRTPTYQEVMQQARGAGASGNWDGWSVKPK